MAQQAAFSTAMCEQGMPVSATNRGWLAQILLAQRTGRTCLPVCLGLGKNIFQQVFAGTALPEGDDLRQELLSLREDEWQDINQLLVKYRAGECDGEVLLAAVVAAGCLGGDHLWRDIGLNSRAELRQLLNDNFPSLVDANRADMKWKKFFYKQLCEAEGGYVCRAPSCEVCSAYDDCFGPEN